MAAHDPGVLVCFDRTHSETGALLARRNGGRVGQVLTWRLDPTPKVAASALPGSGRRTITATSLRLPMLCSSRLFHGGLV